MFLCQCVTTIAIQLFGVVIVLCQWDIYVLAAPTAVLYGTTCSYSKKNSPYPTITALETLQMTVYAVNVDS
jgi:hypothetical protein